MNQPLISIVVPIYNSEEYIEECVSSVIKQTYKNIEILCIYDENSTDNVLKCLKNISDSRIKIINTNVFNLGGSRNIGINNAKGKYIYFLDADDWITPTCIETLYNEMLNSKNDLIICSTLLFDNITLTFQQEPYFDHTNFINLAINKDGAFSREVILNNISGFDVCAWNKLFKKSIIDQYNIRFPEKVLFEDTRFTLEYVINSTKLIKFVPKFLHYYRINVKKSLTKGNKKLTDIFKVADDLEQLFKKYNLFDQYEYLLKQYLGYAVIHRATASGRVASPEYFSLMSNAIKNRKIIVKQRLEKLAKNPKVLRVYFKYLLTYKPLIKKWQKTVITLCKYLLELALEMLHRAINLPVLLLRLLRYDIKIKKLK